MRNTLVLLVLVISSSFGVNGQTGIDLDNSKGTSMMPITTNLIDVVTAIEKSDVEIVHIEFDLLFENGSKEIIRNLSKDYTYGFMAYGDYRISKIGIDLYKESGDSWEYLKSGEITEGTMSLLYKVDEAAKYKIVLRTLEMAEGYTAGHYGLVVIHD
jgi:hypothetical protein